MKPWKGAVAGGLFGLVLGFVLLPDIAAAPVFGLLVFGFIGFDCVWAFNTIRSTKKLSRQVKDDMNPDHTVPPPLPDEKDTGTSADSKDSES